MGCRPLPEDRRRCKAGEARAADSRRLDALLAPYGRVVGGTVLYRLLETPLAPATFERLTQRIGGINTYRMLYQGDLYLPSKVPPMFSGWLEYRDYLMDHVVSEKQRPIFEKFIKGRNTEKEAEWDVVGILRNDVCGTTWANIKSSERVKQKYHKED